MTVFVHIVCCSCGVDFGLTKGVHDLCKADSRRLFYCPNGHSQHFTESEADKLRRERDRLKQNQAWYEERNAELRDELTTATRRVSAFKGQVTKLKTRAAAGVCPCCNRQFVDLKRHMTTKHAGFLAEEVQEREGRTLQ